MWGVLKEKFLSSFQNDLANKFKEAITCEEANLAPQRAKESNSSKMAPISK